MKTLRRYVFRDFSSLFAALLVLVICVILFFVGLGRIPFYDKGEPREALQVREMVIGGRWILPVVEGVLFPEKPPFYHWLCAFTSRLFGRIDEFTVRLPSALLGTVGVLLTFFAGRAFWGLRAGVVSAVVLATSFEWWRAATAARIDMTLTVLVTANLLLFFFWYRREALGIGGILVLALLSAFGTLAKGPVGVVLPCAVVFVFLAIRGEVSFVRARILPLLAGASLFLLIVGSWYLLAYKEGGQHFIEIQLLKENIFRFFARDSKGSGHDHPITYFTPCLIVGMVPWSLFIPGILRSLIRDRRIPKGDEMVYLLVWFATVFVLFSVSAGKRSVYILPLYPSAALLFGAWWQNLGKEDLFSSRLVRCFAYLMAGLLFVAIPLVLAQLLGIDILNIIRDLVDPKNEADLGIGYTVIESHRLLWGLWGVLGTVVAVLLVIFSRRGTWDGVFTCVAALMILTFLLARHGVTSILAQRDSFVSFASRVQERVGRETPIYFCGSLDYDMIFYVGRPIHECSESAEDIPNSGYVLMWEDDWEGLKEGEQNSFDTVDVSDTTNGDDDRLFLLRRKQNAMADWDLHDAQHLGCCYSCLPHLSKRGPL